MRLDDVYQSSRLGNYRSSLAQPYLKSSASTGGRFCTNNRRVAGGFGAARYYGYCGDSQSEQTQANRVPYERLPATVKATSSHSSLRISIRGAEFAIPLIKTFTISFTSTSWIDGFAMWKPAMICPRIGSCLWIEL
jgi:hypothetical protein